MARKPRTSYKRMGHTKPGGAEQLTHITGKLVANPDKPQQYTSGASTELDLSRDFLEKISKSTGQEKIDAEAIYQLLPDVELAEQVLVGSIISPRDMYTKELGFSIEEGKFDGDIARPLLDVVEEHFKKRYKIDDQLDEILENILFKKGSHILMVLPENNLDALINGNPNVSTENFNVSAESMSGPIGFLGSPSSTGAGMESYTQQDVSTLQHQTDSRPLKVPKVTVTDNYNVLKRKHLRSSLRDNRIRDLIRKQSPSMEARQTEVDAKPQKAKQYTDEDLNRLYTDRESEGRHVQVVAPQAYTHRASKGHPLVTQLPPEAVIPVFPPDQPSEHQGYFLLIDGDGNFLTRSNSRDYYGEIQNNFQNSTGDENSNLLQRTRDAINGFDASGQSEADLNQIEQAFASIVENDLNNRLRNGLYEEELTYHFTQDIYRLMLGRSLKAKQTQILYVPAELVTYMAFDFDENGIGESLLAKSKILASMRTVVQFAETMSMVRSAVGRKRVKIDVDENDPDPQKTISDIQELVAMGSQKAFPVGSPDPSMTLDFLRRAGYDFDINVQGENYPNTKVDFEDTQTQETGGNSDLADRLRRQHISSWGLNPETVDPTASPDFATSVVNNNLILTRRVLRYQKRYTGFLSKHVKTFTFYSEALLQDLYKVVEDQKNQLTPEQKKLSTEQVVVEFIESIQTTLPQPDTTKMESQASSFDTYRNFLDSALGAYITEDILPADVLAEDEGALSKVIATIRAYYERQWLANNNILPELQQLVEMEDKKPTFNLLEIQESLYGSLGTAMKEYLTEMTKQTKKWKKETEKREEKYGESEETEEGGENTPEEGGDDFGSDEETAFDDGGEEDDTTGETEESGEEDTAPDEFGEEGKGDAFTDATEDDSEEEEDDNDEEK